LERIRAGVAFVTAASMSQGQLFHQYCQVGGASGRLG
jgi:hypothetical protein